MTKKLNVIGYVVAGIFTIIELAIIGVGYAVWKWPPAILIPTIGMLTFFGVLIIVNIFSASSDLRKGEIRNAIAASLLAVYFFMIAVTLFAPSSPVFKLQTTSAASVAQSQEEATPSPTETPETESTGSTPVTENQAQPTSVNDIVKSLLDDYTSLMMIVVGFYFGGRSAEEIVKTLRGGRSNENLPVEPVEPDEPSDEPNEEPTK